MTEDKIKGTLLTAEYNRDGTVLPGNGSPSLYLLPDDRAGFAYVPLGYATPLGHQFFPQKGDAPDGVEYFRGLGGIPVDVLKPAISFRDRHRDSQSIDVLIGHDLRALTEGELKKGYSLVRLFSNKDDPKELRREEREKCDKLVSLYATEILSHQNRRSRFVSRLKFLSHAYREERNAAWKEFLVNSDCNYGREALFQAIYGKELPLTGTLSLRKVQREE